MTTRTLFSYIGTRAPPTPKRAKAATLNTPDLPPELHERAILERRKHILRLYNDPKNHEGLGITFKQCTTVLTIVQSYPYILDHLEVGYEDGQVDPHNNDNNPQVPINPFKVAGIILSCAVREADASTIQNYIQRVFAQFDKWAVAGEQYQHFSLSKFLQKNIPGPSLGFLVLKKRFSEKDVVHVVLSFPAILNQNQSYLLMHWATYNPTEYDRIKTMVDYGIDIFAKRRYVFLNGRRPIYKTAMDILMEKATKLWDEYQKHFRLFNKTGNRRDLNLFNRCIKQIDAIKKSVRLIFRKMQLYTAVTNQNMPNELLGIIEDYMIGKNGDITDDVQELHEADLDIAIMRHYPNSRFF